MTQHAEWSGLLAEGETILWQGRPLPRLKLEYYTTFDLFVALGMTIASICWFAIALEFSWTAQLLGVALVSGSIYHLVIRHFVFMFLRSKTHYTLTNQRAFIARDFIVRTLDSYPITADTELQFVAGNPGSIYFAYEEVYSRHRLQIKKTGFEMIPNPHDVYELMVTNKRTRT